MKGNRHIKMIKLLKAMSIVLLALTPLFMVMAYMSRGYFALGGEVVAWVIPLLFVVELESEVA